MKWFLCVVFISVCSLNAFSQTRPVNVDPTKGTIAYKAKVISSKDEFVKLDNGAVVEITSGYLGYVGYYKTCVLYRAGYGCEIWIEGKRVFKCNLLKVPDEPFLSNPLSARKATIEKVKGNGSILAMTDGTIYEVDELDEINTMLWIGFEDVLIMENGTLINLSQNSSMIKVNKL